MFLITAGVFELVLLVERRTAGADGPGLSCPAALTSLFLVSTPSPCRLRQGEPGNQINQKAIRKAKRNTPPAPRAVIFQSGAVEEGRLYITQTISYLALGVNRCKGFGGLTHWIRGGLADYGWIRGAGPALPDKRRWCC